MTDLIDYFEWDDAMQADYDEYMQREFDAIQEKEYVAYMEEQERLYYEEHGYYDEGLPEDSTRYPEEEDWSEDDFPR